MRAGSGEIKEEGDYVNTAAAATEDKAAATSGNKFASFAQVVPPPAACWVALLLIMSVRIYYTSVMDANIATLTAETQHLKIQNQNLTVQIQQLETQNQNLTVQNQQLETQNQNLTVQDQQLETQNQNLTILNQQLETQNHNLTVQIQQLETQNQNLTVQNQQLETQNQNLTIMNQQLGTQNQNLRVQIQQLETQNQNLTIQNQQLETQNQNLTEKIQDMEMKWKEQNISRAQWSFDVYCRNQPDRQCKPCQPGWLKNQSSCFVSKNVPPVERRSWDDARADCIEHNSDLAVIDNAEQKAFVSENSYNSSGTTGFWIGLRVTDGKWKWVDGSELAESSWITQPPVAGQCAISVMDNTWKSVSCEQRQQWICKMKALTL